MCFVVTNVLISNAKPGQSADSAKLNIDTFQDLQQLLGVFSKSKHFTNFILLHGMGTLQIKQSRDPSRVTNIDYTGEMD